MAIYCFSHVVTPFLLWPRLFPDDLCCCDSFDSLDTLVLPLGIFRVGNGVYLLGNPIEIEDRTLHMLPLPVFLCVVLSSGLAPRTVWTWVVAFSLRMIFTMHTMHICCGFVWNDLCKMYTRDEDLKSWVYLVDLPSIAPWVDVVDVLQQAMENRRPPPGKPTRILQPWILGSILPSETLPLSSHHGTCFCFRFSFSFPHQKRSFSSPRMYNPQRHSERTGIASSYRSEWFNETESIHLHKSYPFVWSLWKSTRSNSGFR